MLILSQAALIEFSKIVLHLFCGSARKEFFNSLEEGGISSSRIHKENSTYKKQLEAYMNQRKAKK